jgi:hypothetical protein
MYIMYAMRFIQISPLVLEVWCILSYNEEEMASISQNLVFLVLRTIRQNTLYFYLGYKNLWLYPVLLNQKVWLPRTCDKILLFDMDDSSVKIWVIVFYVVTLCNLVDVYQDYKRTCLYYQSS